MISEQVERRHRQLQEIGNILEYWLKWVRGERDAEGLETTPDRHIMLSYENAPPHWPTVGQLRLWIEVIRDVEAIGSLPVEEE